MSGGVLRTGWQARSIHTPHAHSYLHTAHTNLPPLSSLLHVNVNVYVYVCAPWCMFTCLCFCAEVVPAKVKVVDVREQLQKTLDEFTPRCLNDDDDAGDD